MPDLDLVMRGLVRDVGAALRPLGFRASSELDAACAGLRESFADRPQAAGHVDRLVAWARTRASGSAAGRR